MSEPLDESERKFSERQFPLFSDADVLRYGSGPVYDEIVTGTGRLRPHWQSLMGRLAPLDPQQMAERRDEAVGLLRQNGVTYTVYGDPQGAERVWPLDLIPVLIPDSEWKEIEAGVQQRARLLNALLADIHGPQRMVAEGKLPSILLEANPNFLRPCYDIRPVGDTYLHLYAVDLARGPDGRWWVLADRTEAPSGAGYALENRSVIGRVLADCISQAPVRPLTPFFSALREGLTALAPAESIGRAGRPRIVLLTPGPYNETYFEHVYLARHLGITLVEGADLTVRDQCVFLKTVSALEPVDVILRRLDDAFCDPLEFRTDSALGIAGLTEAARAGTVTVANALGCGVLQTVAFKPFLPKLCEALLGEEMLLPDVASWWCGGKDELEHVITHIEDLVIKPAFPSPGFEPVFGAELSRAERALLIDRIKANPLDYVGEERITLSNAPVWEHKQLQPRPMVLRVFIAAGPDGFVVMPGGLTRVAADARRPIVSMQWGGHSKDTWILGPETGSDHRHQTHAAPAATTNVVPISEVSMRRAATGELPSRAADGLFWVGRYAERTDGIVRLLRIMLLGLTDTASPYTVRDAEPLLNLATWLQLWPPVAIASELTSGLIPLVQAVLSDPNHPSGVHANLQHLARAAGSVRDQMPPDCWRAAMTLVHDAPLMGSRPTPVQLLLRLDELVTLGSAFWGTVEETILRDASWRFLEIGKRLERAIDLVSVVRGTPGALLPDGPPLRRVDEQRLLNAIMSLAGTRVPAGMRADWTLDRPTVLHGLLAHKNNPRSLTFQLSALSGHLSALPHADGSGGGAHGLVASARELAETARAMIPDSIALACQPFPDSEQGSSQDPLCDAFARLDALLYEISNLMAQAYFAHAFARPA